MRASLLYPRFVRPFCAAKALFSAFSVAKKGLNTEVTETLRALCVEALEAQRTRRSLSWLRSPGHAPPSVRTGVGTLDVLRTVASSGRKGPMAPRTLKLSIITRGILNRATHTDSSRRDPR